MRAPLCVAAVLSLTMTVPTPVTAETSGCVIVHEEGLVPLQVEEPLSCTFPCDAGELEMTVVLHADRGAIKAGCGTWGMAVAFTPDCLVAGFLTAVELCSSTSSHYNYVADNLGECLITPEEGLQVHVTAMMVYEARCEARIV